jgi:hypothetical protein
MLKTFSWDIGLTFIIRVICDRATFPYPSGSYMALMKVKAVVTGSKLTGDKY